MYRAYNKNFRKYGLWRNFCIARSCRVQWMATPWLLMVDAERNILILASDHDLAQFVTLCYVFINPGAIEGKVQLLT